MFFEVRRSGRRPSSAPVRRLGVDTTGDGRRDTEIVISADGREPVIVTRFRDSSAREPFPVDTTGDGEKDHVLVDSSKDGRYDTLVSADAALELLHHGATPSACLRGDEQTAV